MKNILTLLKDKAVIGGIITVLFYQIVLVGLMMSGFSSLTSHANNQTIAIVNEDQQNGEVFAKQFKELLPFKVTTEGSLDKAQQELEDRDIQLIIHIPQGFTEKLVAKEKPLQLDFFINESNPAMVTGTMQGIAAQITNVLSHQLSIQNISGILQDLKVPEDQAKQLVAEISAFSVEANVVKSNPMPPGMHNTMAPMLLSMVSYAGAMIFSMTMVLAMRPYQSKMGKWKTFFAMQGVNVLVSLIAPLVGLAIYFGIQGYDIATFMQLWMLHAFEMLTSILFTSLFILLFGQAGMMLNVPFLLIQNLSSGTSMSQDMMPGFFRFFSHISIMFYNSQLDFNILFGGGKTGYYLTGLVVIAIVTFLLGALIYKFKSVKDPVVQAA